MKTHEKFPTSLREAKAIIYFKQEYRDENDLETWLSRWLSVVEKFSPPPLVQNTLVATTEKQKEEIRKLRHHIPSQVNEKWKLYRKVGGGKVGSDWWVPVSQIDKMMTYVYETGKKSGIPFLAFAHIGRGHPHVNYLCKTAEEKNRAEKMLIDSCRKAVELGGGVAGEHGIGKLHRNLVPIQWPAKKINQMRQIKLTYDPHWILGRGNILNSI